MPNASEVESWSDPVWTRTYASPMSLWTGVAGPEALPGTTDGEWRAWWLAREPDEQPLRVIVGMSRSALARDPGSLPERVAQAVLTNGRSEVDHWLDQPLPPVSITLDSAGVPDITRRQPDPQTTRRAS